MRSPPLLLFLCVQETLSLPCPIRAPPPLLSPLFPFQISIPASLLSPVAHSFRWTSTNPVVLETLPSGSSSPSPPIPNLAVARSLPFPPLPSPAALAAPFPAGPTPSPPPSPSGTAAAASLPFHRPRPLLPVVTLLALGNGSPDVFASVAAVRGGHARTGLGAILSAGAFVSAFVVGAVAVLAGSFPLNSGPFVRDVFFYLIAAFALFYVYLSAEIFLWQAVGFILFYSFFVGFVFWMDLEDAKARSRVHSIYQSTFSTKLPPTAVPDLLENVS